MFSCSGRECFFLWPCSCAVSNPLDFNLMLARSVVINRNEIKFPNNDDIIFIQVMTWRRKNCGGEENFPFGGTSIVLMGAGANQLLKIPFLKNIVPQNELSQAK